jgi:hypothetical protein
MSSDFMQGNPDSSIQVPFSDDEAVDPAKAEELEEDKPDASPEERVARKQRRQERLQRIIQEGKQSKEELAALQADSAATKAELERLKGFVAATATQRPANDAPVADPYEKALDGIYKQQNETWEQYQSAIKDGKLTPERQKYFEDKARDYEAKKTTIITQRVLEQHTAKQREQRGREVWEQRYPEVYGNDKAFRYAQATWEQRKALGEDPTPALADEVFEEAKTRFKLGAKPAPTASDKARMSGLPAAGSGGGGGKTPVAMTPALHKMAIAAHPELSEADALKKWTNTTGKKLRDKKVI